MEKKTSRNLLEYAEAFVNNGGTKSELAIKIATKTGVSLSAAQRYLRGESRTKNKLILAQIAKITGIAPADLFKKF